MQFTILYRDRLTDTKVVDVSKKKTPTRLMVTAADGDIDSLDELLGCFNADPNKADSLRRTALMYAASKNQLEAIKVLFQFDADANKVDIRGHAALMYAIRSEATEAAEFLIERSDFDIRDNDGWSTLMWASLPETSDNTISRLLINYGAEITANDLKQRLSPPLFNPNPFSKSLLYKRDYGFMDWLITNGYAFNTAKHYAYLVKNASTSELNKIEACSDTSKRCAMRAFLKYLRSNT